MSVVTPDPATTTFEWLRVLRVVLLGMLLPLAITISSAAIRPIRMFGWLRLRCHQEAAGEDMSLKKFPQWSGGSADMPRSAAAPPRPKRACWSCASIAKRGIMGRLSSRPSSSSVAEKIDEREGEADGGYAADEDRENAASERTLARSVRGYDLRTLHVLIVRRRLDVIQLDGMVAVHLDESFHE
jgi:hypothetical protein